MQSIYAPDRLAELMISGRKKKGYSQARMAQLLSKHTHRTITQRAVSYWENGHNDQLYADVIAGWFTLTGDRESWDAYEHMTGYDPLDVPPIHPSMNQRAMDTSHNLMQQMREAEDSLRDVMELIRTEKRPGRTLELKGKANLLLKQVFDVIPAVESFFYAMERETDVQIADVTSLWVQKTMADGLLLKIGEESG